MSDLHKQSRHLRREHLRAVRLVSAYLKDRYSGSPLPPELALQDYELAPLYVEQCAALWHLAKPEDLSHDVFVGVTSDFPYRPPFIIVEKTVFDPARLVPNLDRNGFVCTYANEATVNSARPVDVVSAYIERALSILSPASANDPEAIVDEYVAYWRQLAAKPESYTLFVNEKCSSAILPCATVVDASAPRMLVGDSKVAMKRWLGAASRDVSKWGRCLQLILEAAPPLTQPIQNHHLFSLLDAAENVSPRELPRGFVPDALLLRFPTGETGDAMVMLEHQPPAASKKGRIRGAAVAPGFRAETQRYRAYLQASTQTPLRRRSIEDISRSRLFWRGGTGRRLADCRAYIIGVGSIGSKLAAALQGLGVGEFTLIDDEQLRYENLARHACSEVDVGGPKVKALQAALERADHAVEVQPIEQRIGEINLRAVINDHGIKNAIVIDATGDDATQKMIFDSLLPELDAALFVSLWFEPFGVAGQLILGPPRHTPPTYADLFEYHDATTSYRYRHRVVDRADVLRREAGCQSTFMPYSGIDASIFTLTCARRIARKFESGGNDWEQYTWLNDASEAPDLEFRDDVPRPVGGYKMIRIKE